MKAKREYGRPQMTVVVLRQECRLLTGSGLGASRSSYDHGRMDGGSGTGDEVWE